jgi:hypothetical protein
MAALDRKPAMMRHRPGVMLEGHKDKHQGVVDELQSW